MGPDTAVNSATSLGSSSAAAQDGHSRHTSAVDQGATPAFSTSYALALNKPSIDPGIPSMAGQAQALTPRGSYPPSSGNGPRHIPLAGQQHGTSDHTLHEKALSLRAYRLQILASNIANADTPGYKAVDIDVEEALRNGRSTISSIPLKYHVPRQASIDGNTVELDTERVKFAQNAFMYQFSLDRAMKHYMHIMELLRNLKDQ